MPKPGTPVILGEYGNVVPEGYRYSQKLVTPGEDLPLPNAYFKWYDIRPPGVEITREHVDESRAFVSEEAASLRLVKELGFVILHRAGEVLLLLVMTWRNTNEIWESVYVKDLKQAGGYRPVDSDRSHRGTFCVWELGAVWHERDAWRRFLSSARDEEAKRAYLDDKFSGLV